jgi:RNA polymerase sigma-70 factor (ECF subfamily)
MNDRPADAALVRGFLEGDAECHRVVGSWVREVLAHRRFRLGPDAEDVGQEVQRKLLVALRADRFRGQASLRTYVWRVAQHALIDHLRARQARAATVELEQAQEPLDPRPDAEGLAEARQIYGQLLERLGEGCRRLFALAVFEERPYVEIAAILRTTPGAIKTRMARCRREASRICRELVT